jgi:hypothetical protein
LTGRQKQAEINRERHEGKQSRDDALNDSIEVRPCREERVVALM